MIRLRLGLALLGFVLAILGVTLGDLRLVWGAIGVLLGSLALRLFLRQGVKGDSDPEA